MKAISEFVLSVYKPVLGRFHPFEAKQNISNALSTLTDTVDSAIRLQISQKHPLNSKPYFTFSDGTTSLLLSSIDGTRPVSFALRMEISFLLVLARAVNGRKGRLVKRNEKDTCILGETHERRLYC